MKHRKLQKSVKMLNKAKTKEKNVKMVVMKLMEMGEESGILAVVEKDGRQFLVGPPELRDIAAEVKWFAEDNGLTLVEALKGYCEVLSGKYAFIGTHISRDDFGDED